MDLMPGHDCLSMLKAPGGFMEIWPDVTSSSKSKHNMSSPKLFFLWGYSDFFLFFIFFNEASSSAWWPAARWQFRGIQLIKPRIAEHIKKAVCQHFFLTLNQTRAIRGRTPQPWSSHPQYVWDTQRWRYKVKVLLFKWQINLLKKSCVWGTFHRKPISDLLILKQQR